MKKLRGRLDMRIYGDDFSVPGILRALSVSEIRKQTVQPAESGWFTIGRRPVSAQQVTTKLPPSKDLEVSGTPTKKEVGADQLNAYLESFNGSESNCRRHLFNCVYHEALMHAHGRQGVQFHRLLRIIAHTLVDAEQFLRYVLGCLE